MTKTEAEAFCDEVVRDFASLLPRDLLDDEITSLVRQAALDLAGWLQELGETPLDSVQWKVWLAGYFKGLSR